MLILRFIVGILLVSGLLCFAVYIGTREPIWRRRGIVIVRWTVMAGLAFFGVLFFERLVLMF